MNKKYLQVSLLYWLSMISAISVLVIVPAYAQNNYPRDIDKWREKREAELKSDNGWLTVAGLFWLKEGDNTVGAGPENDIELPVGSAPVKVGVIKFNRVSATLIVEDGVTVKSQGQTVRLVRFNPDAKKKPAEVQIGDLTLTIIKREEHYGVRIKDKNSPQRLAFTGLKWFLPDDSYRVKAQFVPYDKPTEIAIPNIQGGAYRMKSPGIVMFKLKGQEYTLEPVEEKGKLFIVFRDLTSGKATYPAGRFLYADMPVKGEVTLDFNKAFNPPCAFTPYATCPLPPPQNRLQIEIEAGEQTYHATTADR